MSLKPSARRTGRELALQILYQCELTGQTVVEVLEHFGDWQVADRDIKGYSREMVERVLERKEELDGHLAKLSKNWTLDRMTALDRNVLRLGAYELLYQPETPVKVVINEAVELAKKYSTTQSGKFVNGVLDALRKYRDEEPKGA